MKKLLICLLLITSILLVACERAQTEENSSVAESSAIVETSSDSDNSPDAESSEASEEKKVWTETERKGNAVITREYRDGKNDYTETTEKYHPFGSVSSKNIKTFKNEIEIQDETTFYSQDGTEIGKTVIYKDDNGNATKGEKYYCTDTIIQTAEYTYDSNGFINGGTVKYTTPDGETIAEGTTGYELIEVYKCCVEDLAIYENGEIVRYEKIGYMFGKVDFIYRDARDIEGNLLYTHEIKPDDLTEIFIYDETEARIYTFENRVIQIVDFFESRFVAEFQVTENKDLVYTARGLSYDSETALLRAEEALAANTGYTVSMFVFRLDEKFHLTKKEKTS